MQLTYTELRSLPSRVLTCYLECGGNHRAMFDLVQGRAASGTQWKTGGVSNGEWVGVSLREVLNMAGIRDSAVSVLLAGLDTESPEGGFRRVVPVDKAMHPDTLLAYALNGEALPKDHGFPVRALVPGWVGSTSIKWLGQIVVSTKQHWTRNNTSSYVLIGDDYPPEGEAEGKVAREQTIKSALALPWPATVPPGRHRILGYAHSPHGTITRVEWSSDSGASWDGAVLSLVAANAVLLGTFRVFLGCDPRRPHVIMTRATDVAGNTQPDRVPVQREGLPVQPAAAAPHRGGLRLFPSLFRPLEEHRQCKAPLGISLQSGLYGYFPFFMMETNASKHIAWNCPEMTTREYLTKEDFRYEMQHYATKEDLAQLEARLVKWMVGLMVGATVAATGFAVLIERLTT